MDGEREGGVEEKWDMEGEREVASDYLDAAAGLYSVFADPLPTFSSSSRGRPLVAGLLPLILRHRRTGRGGG